MVSGPLLEEVARNLALKLQTDRLVLFVGAGISFQSRAAGDPEARIPMWVDLAHSVAKDNNESLGNYAGNLLDLFDGIETDQGRRALEDSVRKCLRDDEFEPSAVHQLIASLPWHIVYTTNYDSLLDRSMGQTDAIVSETDYEKLGRPESERPRLIHLHGDMKNMHTLTGDDYNLWDDRHPVAKANLTEMALNKTFLFIGYSNSDPHLRHGLFPLIRKLGKQREGKNYAWMWNATPQQIHVLSEKSRLNVTCIKEDNDWERALLQLQAHLAVLQQEKVKVHRPGVLLPRNPLKPPVSETNEIRLNGYKLFYHRTSQRLSVRELERRSGVHWRRLNHLERVSNSAVSGPRCFAISSKEEIYAIEQALQLRGVLEFGAGDDFLATYIMYNKVNRGEMGKRGSNSQLSFVPETNAIVFDFGGTLTLPSPPHNTWERLWLSVGYKIEDAANLHRQYNAGKITHQAWCDQTCAKLREKGFSRKHLDDIAAHVRPVPGLAETFQVLTDRNIPISIVSGSIKSIVKQALGSAFDHVDTLKCNDIIFEKSGLIKEIRGHEFDFEGKATFIESVIQARRCRPIEVLFVGNSLNDHWAIQSGARTLCVNPSHTDYTNKFVWSNYIKNMESLTEVLSHV